MDLFTGTSEKWVSRPGSVANSVFEGKNGKYLSVS